MEKVAILSLGNFMRRDDGIACILKEKIKIKARWIDCKNSALKIIDVLPEFDKVIILDAIDFGGTPGEVKTFSLEDIEEIEITSTHLLDLKRLVELSRKIYGKPKEIRIIGIQPADMSYGIGLSEEVAEKIEEIKEKVENLINAYLI